MTPRPDQVLASAAHYGWAVTERTLEDHAECVVCAAFADAGDVRAAPSHWHPCRFPRDQYRQPDLKQEDLF